MKLYTVRFERAYSQDVELVDEAGKLGEDALKKALRRQFLHEFKEHFPRGFDIKSEAHDEHGGDWYSYIVEIPFSGPMAALRTYLQELYDGEAGCAGQFLIKDEAPLLC